MAKHYKLKNLPLEMIVRILKNLPFKDLLRVVQASKLFYQAGSDPSLWSYVALNRAKLVSQGLFNLSTTFPRYKLIKRLDLSTKYPIVASSLVITNDSMITILTESMNTTLEELSLKAFNLSQIPPTLLATAVGRLKKANLWGTNLPTQHVKEVLTESLKQDTLREIDLGFINMEGVELELLVKSLAQLKLVLLYRAKLTTQQCVAFLTKIKDSTRLEVLSLHGINLARVNSTLLANAVKSPKLKKVNFMDTKLSENQRIVVLRAVKDSKLDTLNVHGLNLGENGSTDLWSLDLSTAVNHLTRINLWKTSLSTNQSVIILKNLPKSKTMKDLNLGYVDLSEVPPHLLATSVCELEKVNLMRTKMTSEQCNVFMTRMVDCGKLKDINMNFVNLANVDVQVMAKAVSRLTHADLSFTNMKIQQCAKLFEACIENTSLVYLSLCGVLQYPLKLPDTTTTGVAVVHDAVRKVRRKVGKLVLKDIYLRATPKLFYEERPFFNDQDTL